MILVIDNFDSFTYNLVDYFEQLDVNCRVIRNDVSLDKIRRYDVDGVVLSPGPETPEKAGILLKIIDFYYDKLPVLGICLGHQAICTYFGGELIRAERPVHGKTSSVTAVSSSPLFQNIPKTFNVVRYHSLIVNMVPESMKVTAKTISAEIMAAEHHKLPIFGVQFHPEAFLTEFGLQILKNWVDFNGIRRDRLAE